MTAVALPVHLAPRTLCRAAVRRCRMRSRTGV